MEEQRITNIEQKLDDVAELLKVLVTQQAEILKNSQGTPTDNTITIKENISETVTPKSNERINSNVTDTMDFLSGKTSKKSIDKDTNLDLQPQKTDLPENTKENIINTNLTSGGSDNIENTVENKTTDNKPNATTKKPFNDSERKKSNLETFIGKNIFVILASLLIFIGIVFFAKSILPYFTEQIKFALMCIFSVGFTVFSYFLVQRKKNNLTASMLACGLGTIYITLLTGNLYFKFINAIVLYIALLVWIMVVWFCSNYKTFLFNIIGQVGILVSLILSIFNREVLGNINMLLYVIIFTVVAEVLYEFLFRKEDNYINITCMFLSLIIMQFPIFNNQTMTISEFMGSEKLPLLIIWSLLLLYIVVKNIISNRDSQTKYSIISIVGFLILVSAFTNSFAYKSFKTVCLIYLVYLVLTLLITEKLYYTKERVDILNVLSALSFIGIVVLYYSIFPGKIYISGLIFVLLMSYYIYNTKTTYPNKLFLCEAGVITAINLFYSWRCSLFGYSFFDKAPTMVNLNNIFYAVSSIIISLMCLYVISRKEKDNRNIKAGLYIFSVVNIYSVFKYMANPNRYRPDLKELLLYLFIMALAVAIQAIFNYVYPLFEKTPKISPQKSFILYFIVNIFMSISSISYLFDLEKHIGLYIIGALLLTTLFMLNSSVFLTGKNNKAAIYVGLKITALIFIILRPLKFGSVVSILLFVWAILCIIIGQKFNQKHLRIYALILSLISAIKLIMIDISYTSSLSRAFSFIICGLLCFLISYIYNRIEKQNNLENS